MFDPFAPLEPWTEERHTQWRMIRMKGRMAYFRYSMIRWLATPFAWAMAALAVMTALLGRSTVVLPDDPLPWTQHLWIGGLIIFPCMILLMGMDALSRWPALEQIYERYEAPLPMLDFVVGTSPDHLFAWMSADDFGDTRHVLLAALRNGTWTPSYEARRMPTYQQGERPWVSPGMNQPSDRPFVPPEVGMALLPNGTLILTRRDATLLVFDQPEPRIITTPGIVGYPVPLADGYLFLAGIKGWSNGSARVNLATGALERIDVLTDTEVVASHAGHAYLFDYGRAQIAIIGADSLTYVAHPPTWRPWWITVTPDGTIWAYVISRSGASSALWVYRDVWKPGPDLGEERFPEAMTLDGASLLVVAEQTVWRLAADGTSWVPEQTFDSIEHFRLPMMQSLTHGAVAFPRFAYTPPIMVRRDGSWKPSPPLDPLVEHLQTSRAEQGSA